MFTLGSFSVFFWTLATIILLMIVFEEKLLELEAKYDRKKAIKKRAKTKSQVKINTNSQVKRAPASARIDSTDRRMSKNYAA